MKKTVSIVVLCLAIIATSCSKKSDPVPEPPSPVIGYWTGTYSYTNSIPKINYAILINPGNAARIYDMDEKTDTSLVPAGAKVNGTWSLNGNNLVVTYKSGTKTVTTFGIINESFTKLTGTFALEGVIKGHVTLQK
jgi:hypothetical protein